jgi:hypothetical protein
MYATVEIQADTLVINLLHKEKKDERLFKSRVIVGQADGTLIYFDAAGHLHVVHGTGPGPGPGDLAAQTTRAVAQVLEGVGTLVRLGAGAEAAGV